MKASASGGLSLTIQSDKLSNEPLKVDKAALPTDAKARKAIPLYSGLVKYFPKALAAVAEVSRIGGEQHHPGEKLHWDRNKSTDEHDALLRHLWEAGTIDVDGCRHSAKLAWRALSALEKELEAENVGKS